MAISLRLAGKALATRVLDDALVVGVLKISVFLYVVMFGPAICGIFKIPAKLYVDAVTSWAIGFLVAGLLFCIFWIVGSVFWVRAHIKLHQPRQYLVRGTKAIITP